MTTKGRTARLPGTQTKVQKELDDAAEVYVKHRDRRVAALVKEKESKAALISVMKKHKKEVYVDEESGRTVTMTEGATKVSVTDTPEGGSE